MAEVVREIGMRSSYGKEMEGASSDAMEIEGLSPGHTAAYTSTQ